MYRSGSNGSGSQQPNKQMDEEQTQAQIGGSGNGLRLRSGEGIQVDLQGGGDPITYTSPDYSLDGGGTRLATQMGDRFSYTVQSGDTLTGIAQANGRQLGEVLALNHLSNPNAIREGQEIVIPADGVVPSDVSRRLEGGFYQWNARQEAIAANNVIGTDGMRIGPTIERAQAMGIYSGNQVQTAGMAYPDSPSMTAWDGVVRDSPAVAYLKSQSGGLDPIRGDQMQFRVAQMLPDAALNEVGGLVAGKIIGRITGWGEQVTARVTSLDPYDALQIVNTPKGFRPLPETYMPDSMINAHAALFEGGASRIQPNLPTGTIGRTETWVMPQSFADRAITEAGGDVRKLEQLLGLDKGYLGNSPVRVDIPQPVGLRMSSGNEYGANHLWNPGGYTNGGIPEAVINPVPPSAYKITPIR